MVTIRINRPFSVKAVMCKEVNLENTEFFEAS